MWIALKEQKVKRSGEYVVVVRGDPLPEAEFWSNRNSFERQGFIRWVPGEAKAEKKVEVKIKKPEPIEKPVIKEPVVEELVVEEKEEMVFTPVARKKKGRR